MSKLMQKNQIEKLFFQPVFHYESHTVEISPVIARRLLDNTDSKIQRKLTRTHVLKLAEEMKKGRFQLNGISIKQDQIGNIIDGQHRLNACIEANKPFKTDFVKGLKTETIETIDIGARARTLTDVLEISHRQNYKYGTHMSATIKFIYAFGNGVYSKAGVGTRATNLSGKEFLIWIDKNPKIIDFVAETMRMRANGDKIIKASIFCGLKWILDGYNKPESDKFFQMLSDGIGIDNMSPIFALRKRIMASKFSRVTKAYKMSQKELLCSIVQTWNNYLSCKRIKTFRIQRDLPKIKSVKKQLFE